MSTLADQRQRDLTVGKEKMQQLRAELDTTRRKCRVQAQQITNLKSELKKKVKMSSPSDQLEQPQTELEMLHKKSKAISQKQLKESEEVLILSSVDGELLSCVDKCFVSA